MNELIRLLKYIWRAWPVIIILFILTFHILLIRYLMLPPVTTHKTISLFSQLFGGLLVLYSIDSNIGIIKRKNLYDIFRAYLKEFPLIKRHVTIQAHSGAMTLTGGKVKLRVTRNPKTLDEKIEYLQEQLNEVRREVETETTELHKKIDTRAEAIDARLNDTQETIKNIETKIEEVSIGGIKIQIFGLLLVVYGSITGYIA